MPWRKPFFFIKSHEVPFACYKCIHALVWLRSLQALLDRSPFLQVFQQILWVLQASVPWDQRETRQAACAGPWPWGSAVWDSSGAPRPRVGDSGNEAQGGWCRGDPQPTQPPQPKITSRWHQGVPRTWVLQRWQAQQASRLF